ncbi:MAG TPA: efflux RND transporter periplasmic adaptor subunit [Candidatus Dormibacteraeota bacterium]|nr:efflux RND transporter periplasmic adaptor subunit [Candidatus Dormibacteraeota bacterium]
MAKDGKPRRGKWLVVFLILVVVVVAVVWYGKTDHEDAPQYQTATVTRGDLTQAVTASGTLNPVINVQVGSQVSGNIQKLYADWNSLVKSNQVVAQLDPAVFQATVHQAEGDLANAKASLELAVVNARRSAELLTNHLVAPSEDDKAQADLHQAQAQVAIKEAALEKAKVDLAHCTIYAPVDGIVISRNVDVGQTVAASMNAPTLFVIANDLSKMQIDSNVSEADVGTVEEGQTTTFTVDAYPNRTFTGKVSQIRNAPITVQNVVTYDTVIAVRNDDQKLKPGMTATVSIITAKRTGVLKVPNLALRFKPLEPPTNQNFIARLFAKFSAGKPAGSTNGLTATSTTNKPGETASTQLTGNEPPEELMRKVREMRDRGEEPPPEIRAKLRELFQSGALQRGGGGAPGGAGAGAQRPRAAQPAFRTVYVPSTNTTSHADETVKPEPVRIKAGISDGAATEVTDGLKEGDLVITSVKYAQSQAPAAPQSGSSPFGGGGRRGF